MAYKKETTRDPMYDESKIKGGGKKKGPVELFPIKKAKVSPRNKKAPGPNA